MIDIVLVYPPAVTAGRYKQVATGHEVAPQPLLYLGAILRKNGFNCKLIDANVMGLTVDETVKAILEYNPKCVGISSPTMLI